MVFILSPTVSTERDVRQDQLYEGLRWGGEDWKMRRRVQIGGEPAPGRVRDDDVKGCINRAGARVSLNVVETRRD